VISVAVPVIVPVTEFCGEAVIVGDGVGVGVIVGVAGMGDAVAK